MYQRSSSTPIRPVSLIENPQKNPYQQPWTPGPISSPTILPFELGSTIDDPVRGSSYNLIQPLGNGSYAVVYMVRNKKDNKYYALKCLSKENLSDYHLSIQHNEVVLHERVTGHSNLVKLHHTFETPEWLFLVMEYCDGQDLYFWLTQNNDATDPYSRRNLTERERLELVKQVFDQILDAVGHCHDNGIAHRDLKPENFIVTVSDKNKVQVKLTDFGLATDEVESSDFDCGSKPYMSYECRNAVRETYHPRLADIWSLGIIFLNLIYHRSPWSDPNPDHCKSFAAFQTDKVSFLQSRFERLPNKVAHFLATRVFCRPEEGRVSIREWKFWCKNLVQKMMEEEDEEEDDIFQVDDLDLHKLSLSTVHAESNSQWRYSRARKESWSDIMTDNEMDFTVPVTFTDDEGSCRASVNKIKETRMEIPKVATEKKVDENRDIEQQNANNSDADSGFGTDEDGNANITKRGRAQENASKTTRTSESTTLSITPPKVIHCKPRPWGQSKEIREQKERKEQRERGHQREPSSVDYDSPPNDHWSSYNQRRERLERQRKEKEGKKLDMLAQNRRRGSSVGSQDAFSYAAVNSFPRRARPYRPSENRVVYFNINVTPPKTLKGTPPTSPTRLKHFELKNSPPETCLSSSIPDKKLRSKISRENLASNINSPVKVAKSTKTNLGRMLETMVVFNRGVKVGGRGIDS